MDRHLQLESIQLLLDRHRHVRCQAITGRRLTLSIVCPRVIRAVDCAFRCPDDPTSCWDRHASRSIGLGRADEMEVGCGCIDGWVLVGRERHILNG